jgi:leucyl-tRNA synthetase
MGFALDADNGAIEQEVLANEIVQRWMEGKTLKKVVIVKGRMINVVV